MKPLSQLTAITAAAAAILTTTALLSAKELSLPAERTWQLTLSSQPAGFLEESTVNAPTGSTTTKEKMTMELNRLGSKVSITNESETVETVEGEMRSLVATMSSSEVATTIHVTRADHVLKVETESGGKSYQKELPFSGSLVGPKGIEKLSREKLSNEGTAISYQTFVPEFGTIARTTRRVIGVLDEKGEKLLKCEEVIEGFPGKLSITVNAKGRWITRQQTFPFGELVIEPVNSAASPQAGAPSGAELPQESYDRTLARSNIALPDPRNINAVTLRIRHLKPDLGWPDLTAPGQRVLEQANETRLLEIRRRDLGKGDSDAKPDASCLRPNALVQSDDPEVIRIAREATVNAKSDFEKARQLQDWVSANLRFDLGVALASASEVARNRRGTCIAYAVLLAALERAAGLPSRVAMGLVYADGIWGGHAWSECYIDNRWIALDAALFAPGPADAARVGFGASSGEDQLIRLVAAGAQLYGNIDCTVTAFEYEGHVVKVPEKATRFEIKGHRYSNPWLGFSLDAPDGFRFTKTDAVFPDSTVVELEGSNAAKVRVEVNNTGSDRDAGVKKAFSSLGDPKTTSRTIGTLKGDFAITQKGSRLVLKRGNSLWVLTAEGDSSDKLLEQIASTWRWTL